jgi:hypothetical protein
MRDASRDLVDVVERSVIALARISDAESAVRPAPGKWSPREVLGHLVDSAANNHQRFVRAQFQADLVFPGYMQDDWVRVQRYQETPWAELVTLWRAYNLHIARVMAAVPTEARRRAVAKHDFDQIGWRTFSRDAVVTLDDLMHDYVGHLRHHMDRVLATAT